MAGELSRSRVALAKGGGRAENVEATLRLIESDIHLEGKSGVFIKVNFVSTTNQLAATHVDSVRALLRFIRERYDGRIAIGESTAVPASEGFANYGYLDLVKEFNVELVDLNDGEWVDVAVYDSHLRPFNVRFSKLAAESDYRISIGPPKTHDIVVVTLSIKNLVMGALYYRVKKGSGGAVRGLARRGYGLLPSSMRKSARVSRMRDSAAALAGGDKRKMHQGLPVHNLNLYLVARAYPVHLAVIDGYIGMEGNGPEAGDPVDWGVALAGCDPVAADCLAAHLMGFDLSDIGYLWYCASMGLGTGEIDRMEILGAEPRECLRPFRPPPTFEKQTAWRDDGVDRLLGLPPRG
jgi:uncharacterized protein (DUF362 family)